jgi:hypothetical protein
MAGVVEVIRGRPSLDRLVAGREHLDHAAVVADQVPFASGRDVTLVEIPGVELGIDAGNASTKLVAENPELVGVDGLSGLEVFELTGRRRVVPVCPVHTLKDLGELVAAVSAHQERVHLRKMLDDPGILMLSVAIDVLDPLGSERLQDLGHVGPPGGTEFGDVGGHADHMAIRGLESDGLGTVAEVLGPFGDLFGDPACIGVIEQLVGVLVLVALQRFLELVEAALIAGAGG